MGGLSAVLVAQIESRERSEAGGKRKTYDAVKGMLSSCVVG